MFVAVWALLCFTGFVASQSLDDCPVGVTRDEYLKRYNEFCLEFRLNTYNDYPTAEADCEGRGGTLALVKDKGISDFIIDQMIFEFQFQDRVWIGLTDSVTETQFVWADGTPLDRDGFTNFAADQGDSNALEDCVTLDPNRNGEWHDYHCTNEIFGLINYEFPYICQYNAKTATTSATAK